MANNPERIDLAVDKIIAVFAPTWKATADAQCRAELRQILSALVEPEWQPLEAIDDLLAPLTGDTKQKETT